MKASLPLGAGVLALSMSVSAPAFSQYAVTRLTQDAEIENHPAWSPDGTRVAYDSKAGLFILNLADGVKTMLDPIGDEPSWSPSSSFIVFLRGDGYLWLINSAGGYPAQWLTIGGRNMKWSPDAAYVASVVQAGPPGSWIRVFPLSGGDPKTLSHSSNVWTFGWAPDSRTFIVSDGQSLWTTTTDDEGPIPLFDDMYAWYPAWSPDGTTIAFSAIDGIWTIPASGGSSEHIWTRDPDQWFFDDLMTTWSPDSRRLIFNAYDGETFDLYMIDLDAPVPARPTTWGRIKAKYGN